MPAAKPSVPVFLLFFCLSAAYPAVGQDVAVVLRDTVLIQDNPARSVSVFAGEILPYHNGRVAVALDSLPLDEGIFRILDRSALDATVDYRKFLFRKATDTLFFHNKGALPLSTALFIIDGHYRKFGLTGLSEAKLPLSAITTTFRLQIENQAQEWINLGELPVFAPAEPASEVSGDTGGGMGLLLLLAGLFAALTGYVSYRNRQLRRLLEVAPAAAPMAPQQVEQPPAASAPADAVVNSQVAASASLPPDSLLLPLGREKAAAVLDHLLEINRQYSRLADLYLQPDPGSPAARACLGYMIANLWQEQQKLGGGKWPTLLDNWSRTSRLVGAEWIRPYQQISNKEQVVDMLWDDFYYEHYQAFVNNLLIFWTEVGYLSHFAGGAGQPPRPAEADLYRALEDLSFESKHYLIDRSNELLSVKIEDARLLEPLSKYQAIAQAVDNQPPPHYYGNIRNLAQMRAQAEKDNYIACIIRFAITYKQKSEPLKVFVDRYAF